MIELSYEDNSKNQYKINIDRVKRKLWESSAKSNNEFVEISWYKLFDKGKERIQDLMTSRLVDEEYVKILSYWFLARYGYKLKGVNYVGI